MVVSAFSRVEPVFLANKNWGIGETEVLGHEKGAACDHDLRRSSMLQGKESWSQGSDPRPVAGDLVKSLVYVSVFVFSS